MTRQIVLKEDVANYISDGMDVRIVDELIRRTNLIIENSEERDIGTGMSGSFIRFGMALGTMGYPFADSPKWLGDDDKTQFMTSEEYGGTTYDPVMNELFEKAYSAVNG
jgi:hypothetical protein